MTDNNVDGVFAPYFATRWLAAYYAGDSDQARAILHTLDYRGLAMVLGSLGEIFIQTLEKVDAAGALGSGGVQVWLDSMAINVGAAAERVAAEHRCDNTEHDDD